MAGTGRDHLLTDTEILAALGRAAKDGGEEWLPDSTRRGEGRLCFRALPSGGHWYFRYTKSNGTRDTLPIGSYAQPGRTKNESRAAGYTLKDARMKADELASLLKHPETADIRAHLESQQRAAEAKHEADQRAAEERRRVERSRSLTLGRLCELYCDYLQAQGKTSAQSVRNALTLHVLSQSVADKPAREVNRAELAQIIRQLVEDGKTRIAGLIRSYLSSAYTLAMNAEGDTTAPSALIPFNIETNPTSGIKAIPVAERNRVLTETELRAFMRRLGEGKSAIRDTLQFCLLAGGQRPEQVARAQIKDYSDGMLTLLDSKGNRRNPRIHVLPLAPRARLLLDGLVARAQTLGSAILFSSTGRLPVDISRVSRQATAISREMVEAGEAVEPFQAKDLRRTVETMLAPKQMHVSKDIRAQVMSHGLSGVQVQRYDRYEYLEEKRQALERWERRLTEIETGTQSRVVPFPKAG